MSIQLLTLLPSILFKHRLLRLMFHIIYRTRNPQFSTLNNLLQIQMILLLLLHVAVAQNWNCSDRHQTLLCPVRIAFPLAIALMTSLTQLLHLLLTSTRTTLKSLLVMQKLLTHVPLPLPLLADLTSP
ncbi:hypothetical protein PLICRDRAFT_180615 [Plicaturopsis crispa FD-325 SS-3]|uniref:Uncharacterized protein n=1 Tax=Plicaturopsis crispa FD-325 SS-3 TaxID=944288 RepID=A0A0C9T1Z5_PLICR|nr:hypothetical protein PLICRDRAFT_180615 [Plicaturopsis crispa FD-325 SS-3]